VLRVQTYRRRSHAQEARRGRPHVENPTRHCRRHALREPALGLTARPAPPPQTPGRPKQKQYDVFIAYAYEDKDAVARPLADVLRKRLNVWYDEFALDVGDSLRREIERGLAGSRYGVVILSPNFFKKEWPQKELDGLTAREVEGRKVVLPVWHEIDAEGVRREAPSLADKVAARTGDGIGAVAAKLLAVITGREDDISGALHTQRGDVMGDRAGALSVDTEVELRRPEFERQIAKLRPQQEVVLHYVVRVGDSDATQLRQFLGEQGQTVSLSRRRPSVDDHRRDRPFGSQIEGQRIRTLSV
jgi:hypothetical protein